MGHFPLYVWGAFVLFIVGMLALDLGVFQRKSHSISVKEAMLWSAFWIALALLFNVGVYVLYGKEYGTSFLTGYIIEKSLSVDNLFVFLLIFTYFKVAKEHQHKVLYWGVIGAIVMRAIFIFAGIALIEKFHFIIYLFGAFLLFTGIKMSFSGEQKMQPEKNILFRISRKILPVTSDYRGGSFFVRENERLMATPMFLVLIVVESSDLVFAVDSIPAIIAITREPFIVFTSNIFAILGLRSLYFALAGFVDKFYYLRHALSVILIYIGVKMLISDHYKIPTFMSQSIIILVLLVAVLLSFIKDSKIQNK